MEQPYPDMAKSNDRGRPTPCQVLLLVEAQNNHRFVAEPFHPRRLFRGGHAQTVAGNFIRRQNLLPPAEERLFEVEPGMRLLCYCHWQADRQSAMTLIIVHGLEGSAESRYMIGTGSKAWLEGMNVVRMNMRNCGNTEHLGPTLYNSSMSADVEIVVRTLIADEKLQAIALVGYSMGGNLVLKMLGEWGSEAPPQLKAGVGVSPAMDLAPSADALHNLGNRIYEYRFLRDLRQRVRRKAALYPGRYDLKYLRGLRSIRDFDEQITARYCGFSGAQDYYTRAASANVLECIALPTLVLHAEDDPFIRILPDTRRKLESNANITFVETAAGGHCAFLAEPNGYDGRWAERQTIRFIETHRL